jgi:uncharacterized protein (TIGR02117 family)
VLRAAKRVALGLACITLILIAVALLTARSGDRALYPPPPGAPTYDIFVVNHGYHTGVVLPREVVAKLAGARGHVALIAVAARFGAFPWIEFGWGDEGFYREVPTAAALTVGLALRALFKPGNPSVLHVVGVGDDPAAVFVHSDVLRITLSEAGLERLMALLDATFARGPDGRIADDLGRGLYGPSLFYRAVGTFNLLSVCNHWVANLLDAAGVPTAPVLATLPYGLLLDLRWRSGVVPMVRQ